jgi:ATP-dependent helicase HrpB
MRLPDPSQLPDLPVRAVLGAVTDALAAHGNAVLVAPPGTGKTTLVPLALAAAVDPDLGRVLVAEPRRLATRAAAARMAVLLGEPVGETVGYAVRGDSRRSDRTSIEVVTSGLLLRRLMADPELDGVHTVLLDECHERHLDADLLLALLLDARAGLRPDLRLLATSATVATDRLTDLLDGAPVLRVEARMFAVATRHTPPARGERIETCVARAVRTALHEGDGDVLAFLPGVPEIRRTATLLAGTDLAGVDVLQLHGRLRPAEQDLALTPGPRRRVVLSTAVAESSLTVPGVRAVVDAGLARTPRTDHRRGLAGLVTVRVSAAVAEQRAGRAGREAPGRVYRCWPEGELLVRYPEPEIRTADLTRLALDLACWGTPDGSGLRWWDPPPAGPLQAGQQVLRALGALDDGGVTDRGRRLSELGLHPRLARALLDGAALVGARAAAEVVALIDDDTLAEGVAVDDELRRLRTGSARGAGRWRVEVTRLQRLVPRASAAAPAPTGPGDGAAALVVALAYPERLARRRPAGTGPRRLHRDVYLMSGGTAAELPAGSPLAGQEWLAVAVADRTPGAEHGRIRLAAAADRELAELAAPALLVEEDEVAWVDGDVVARRVRRLGAIVLTERRLERPAPEAVASALRHGLRSEGLGLLGWSGHARRLRDRLATLHRAFADDWPDVSDAALLADPDRWWGPALARARNRADLARIDAATVLRALLDHRHAARLDELAPERIAVPSGARIAVDYSADQPVLAVKVQEVFGWTGTPTVADGRLPVVLHLLSPAGRPAAVTADLTSFWATGYAQVRAELRGRYPKHAWPEDPTSAPTGSSRRPG